MKKPLPLLFGLLTLYILGSSFWYANSACCAGIAGATSMVESTAPAAAATAAAVGESSGAAAGVAVGELSLEEQLKATSLSLYFDNDSEEIIMDEDKREYLANLYTYLKEHEEAGVMVVGHTDNDGDPDNNKIISLNRAEFVRDFLIGYDIRPEQIEAKGVGEEEPIADNGTEEGRDANRRVEIIVK